MLARQLFAFCLLAIATVLITSVAYFYFRGQWITFYRGEALYEKKQYEEAIPYYEGAMHQGLYTRRLVFHYGDALTSTHQFERAAQLYRTYLDTHAGDQTARHRYAQVLSYLGNYEESIQQSESLLNQQEEKR